MTNRLDHILIVDDDPEICHLLRDYLEKNGFRATAVSNGKALWRTLDDKQIDLVVLDLMLPGEDGLELCRNLRARFDIPILILSALGEETDRIIGLEMGADDYLPKPFNPRELLARVKVILRRTRSLPGTTAETETRSRLLFAEWKLDLITRNLVSPAGVVVPLSAGEFRLLRVFLEHPKRVLTRDQLLELTQGREALAFDRSIDVLVGRLRRHLGENAREPRIIQTARGAGYILAAEVRKESGDM
ncbi:two component transcriptional regulator, winged helix family [Candidatus Thiomargarita nelsonii]|uniref:Two component transcriptional regulator, winged helix family n=1 Tax=Candidatus Thiomargarita nelsonii TaxID=1003181 RepID=A0A176S2H4_9GAMM|nr:two component transcriptional regulator, winged helix family [Candidatus Thiomargarita nelsonii]